MERPTMIEHLAARIGQTYTVEDHAAVVTHLAAVERLAQDVITMRDTERRRVLDAECNSLLSRREAPNARMWGEDVPGSEWAI